MLSQRSILFLVFAKAGKYFLSRFFIQLSRIHMEMSLIKNLKFIHTITRTEEAK